MQNFPEPESELPVQVLAGSFRNVTNSYKFYWFLAILDHVSRFHSTTVAINDLAVEMVVLAWYPVNYFNLVFGKQDKLSEAVTNLRIETGLQPNSDKDSIRTAFKSLGVSSKARSIVAERVRYVPYRFVRPWFDQETNRLPDQKVNGRIQELCERDYASSSPPPYRFVAESIEIHPRWFSYINRHIRILQDFCFWNLVTYLQSHNPNVPNVSSKLVAPLDRDLKDARAFWKVAFSELGTVSCPYSDVALTSGEISLDHFLPWSFTAHDLLWNIVPTTNSVNSSKGDRLPKMDRYFQPYANLQYGALQSVVRAGPSRLVEDFVMLWRVDDPRTFLQMDLNAFSDHLRATISPQYEIAANMGFARDWVY